MHINKRLAQLSILALLMTLIVYCSDNNESNDKDTIQDASNDSFANVDTDVDTDNDADSDADEDASIGDGGGDPDGCKWRKMYERKSIFFKDIWGTSSLDIFTVGHKSSPSPEQDPSPAIFNYDGTSWIEINIPPSYTSLMAIWGSGENNVFSGGSYGAMYHYDGTTWSLYNTKQYTCDIWGSSGSDVFSVGESEDLYGNILHFDGEKWSEAFMNRNIYFYGIWQESLSNVYAVGNNQKDGLIIHYDGKQWKIEEELGNSILLDIWGCSESDIYVVGVNKESMTNDHFECSYIWKYHDNGWIAIMENDTEMITMVNGSSRKNIFFVGWKIDKNRKEIIGTVIYHCDGKEFKRMEIDNPWVVTGLWAGSEDEAFASGYELGSKKGVILHYSCD